MDSAEIEAIRQSVADRFYGKHRATVVNNADPQSRGRLQVTVPEILGENIVRWALPAAPYAGDGVGFFAVPPIGANVWVEFEAGNLRYPIWSGCFWAEGEIDTADALPTVKFLKTTAATVRIDDAIGEVTIETGAAKITLTASEVKIEAPQVTNSANGGRTQLTAAGFDAQQGALKVV